MLSTLHSLPPHQQGFSTIIVNSGLFKKKFLVKPKNNRGDKNKDTRGIEACGIYSYDIKHSPTASQINIKIYTKVYVPHFLLLNTSCPAFNNKNTR